MRRRPLLAVALALVALGAATAPPARAATPGMVVRARFTATMPERFGLDADGDGRLDLPNSPEYVSPGAPAGCGQSCSPRFTLQLDATPSIATLDGADLPVVGYRWEIHGSAGWWVRPATASPRVEMSLPEGRYRVALEIEVQLPWGTTRSAAAAHVVVEDLLVVAVGDSYAGGEGNPEVPQVEGVAPAAWADGAGDAAVAAGHEAAHRSTAAWPALAALALERADPGTSVTFVSMAASGARIDSGLLGAQPGVSPAAQIDQVAALVGERAIDLLLVSVGGNDVGFTRIVRGLVDADRLADPVCYGTDLQNVWAAARDGDWNRGSALRWALPWGVGCRETRTSGNPLLPGLDGLPAALDRLAREIDARLDVARVFLMEYPDPTGSGADGEGCDEIVGDVTPPFRFHEISRAEQDEGLARVVRPLNEALAAAAARHGWTFVGGVAAAFASGHGYCASRPDYLPASGPTAPTGAPGVALAEPDRWYRHPATLDPGEALSLAGVSWYRTAAQSVALQGPGEAWDTAGTLHPNELGHLAIAALVLEAVGD